MVYLHNGTLHRNNKKKLFVYKLDGPQDPYERNKTPNIIHYMISFL